MLAEPIVYLVVWTTIAEQQGGSVQGITAGEFAAYYIVWTLVRNMNIVFTPYGWEWRIREGEFSGVAAAAAAPAPRRPGLLRRLEVRRDRALAADRARALLIAFDPVLDADGARDRRLLRSRSGAPT